MDLLTGTVAVADLTVPNDYCSYGIHPLALGDVIDPDDPPMLLYIRERDSWLGSAHTFLDNGDPTYVAEGMAGRNPQWVFFDADFSRLVDQHRDEQYRNRAATSPTEAVVQRSLAERLTTEERPFRREVNVTFGRADFVIDEDPVVVVEVKVNSDPRSMATAIGQLVLYGHDFDAPHLVIAVPQGVEARFVRPLRPWGIEIWTVET